MVVNFARRKRDGRSGELRYLSGSGDFVKHAEPSLPFTIRITGLPDTAITARAGNETMTGWRCWSGFAGCAMPRRTSRRRLYPQRRKEVYVMGRDTGISWTDATFNPWWGCTKVSPGCDHCYAEAFDKRVGGAHWGKGEPRRVFGEKHWNEPLKWNKNAQSEGIALKVFCASMADVMDDEAPEGQRERLWTMIDATPNLIWQLLTKRPHRYARYLPATGFKHGNAWLGTTAENQQYYDSRWPELNRAASMFDLKSFISYEPAIGPLSILGHDEKPDWLIFGGESGSGRRPMETMWPESIKFECEQAGTAFFMKQMSAKTPNEAKSLIPAHLLIHNFPLVST